MSIASEITNYANGLSDAYDAVNDMQGVIPQDKNMNNLDTAIRTIPQSQGATYTAGNGISIDANNEISIDTSVVAEVSDLPTNFTGATSSTAGVSGLVPAPASGDQDKVLKGDGTWGDVQPGMTTYFLADSLENYVSSSNIFSIYKDASLTTAVTSLEFNEVATGGPVQLVYSNPTSTEYYIVGFAYDNSNSYQTYDEMSYDIYNLRTYTIYSIEDLGNGSFKRQGLGKYELQQKLTAGSNIQISASGKTISATDTTYSAGTGISIDANNVISATGGGSVVTLFMYDSGGDLYDASYNYATAQDVLTALGNGKVIVGDIIDYSDSVYEIVSSDSNSYFVAVSRHANGSPEFVTLHYDSTSPTAPMGAWTRTAYIPQQKLTAGTNVSISGTTISATDTTYSDFTGATSSTAGANGLVPAPAAGDEGKALHGDGTWKDTTAKLVEMSYGESGAWAKFIAAYNAGSIVYCRASSNANPGTGSQTRKAFMAYVNNATSPTSVEFQYVRSVSSKSSSQPVDQVFVYTLTNSNGGTWSVATRDMAPKLAAGTNTSVSYASGTYTVSANVPVLNYSTSEVDTGTTWIDGSHIYKKTVNFGALPNATTKTVAHGISNLDKVIEIKGYTSNGTAFTPLPMASTTGAPTVINVNATDIVYTTTSDRTAYSETYVTLYYTKSS